MDRDLRLVASLLRPGDAFVDGGANIGTYALTAAERVGPTGRVFAFEPVPYAFERLMGNIKLNGYHWVEARRVALADTPGREHLFSFPDAHVGFSSFAPEPSDQAVEEMVEVTTLDEAVPASWRDRLRLVKLDVDGAEVRALRGAKQIIDEVGPDFLVEVDPPRLARQATSARILFSMLLDAGYTPHPTATPPNVLFARGDRNVWI